MNFFSCCLLARTDQPLSPAGPLCLASNKPPLFLSLRPPPFHSVSYGEGQMCFQTPDPTLLLRPSADCSKPGCDGVSLVHLRGPPGLLLPSSSPLPASGHLHPSSLSRTHFTPSSVLCSFLCLECPPAGLQQLQPQLLPFSSGYVAHGSMGCG